MPVQKKFNIGILGHQGRMGQSVTQILSKEFENEAVVYAKLDRGNLNQIWFKWKANKSVSLFCS